MAAILKSLEHEAIDNAYIKLMRNIYSTAISVIRIHQESERFKVRKGVRQGDSISPKLLSVVLKRVFQNLNWDEVGIKINGEYFHHLQFADYVACLLQVQKASHFSSHISRSVAILIQVAPGTRLISSIHLAFGRRLGRFFSLRI